MAATGWSYVVPYRSDMAKVLDDLRRDVFLRGAYQRPVPEPEFLEEIGLFEADEGARDELLHAYGLNALRPPIEQVGLEGLRDWLQALYDAPQLQDPGQLAALQCLSSGGTHSILDIEGVSETPAAGSLFPLPQELLRRYFGTAEPTRASVEELHRRNIQMADAYDRGQGIYFPLHREGRPEEIYIEGASGD